MNFVPSIKLNGVIQRVTDKLNKKIFTMIIKPVSCVENLVIGYNYFSLRNLQI